ncbi:EscU/YscU/HrcU family type III secretion system export apparatus switch protein [Mangrovibacillus cuniculi]|uniref:EscU/YscU/HrcU family type III secretion system export apparatus switch protein n=1 Tax=Mangrovibacillus cuniculi TaxID=2593652 RepID=A0A7S8CAB7_9BACI|nr:EscU/YscU/HrcU family type III secretion system export apparatus switch protein [Mangrovibacillus cuniculi]QPC46329.1 EscU/YscU/HrcU family type III secretion system export apparatus switch protein [Mangrovibacillus cuniculi]
MKEQRQEAVALRYNEGKDDAPKVIAKGKGLIAEEILAKAKEFDIPVQEDPAMLSILGTLEINESIPEELFEAVAEVFAFVYQVDKTYKKN